MFALTDSIFYSDRCSFSSLKDYISSCCLTNEEKTFCKFVSNGQVNSYTYKDLFKYIGMLGHLIRRKTKHGDHIAIIGDMSFRWMAVYLAALYHKFVIIPLDSSMKKEEVLKQYSFADGVLLFYSKSLSDVAEYVISETGTSCICIDDLEASNEMLPEELVNINEPDGNENELAEIVFTSGTTGTAKGVMLSYNNILYTVMFCTRIVDADSDETLLSFLPNHHTYELTAGILAPLYFGASIGIIEGMRYFFRDVQLLSPTILLAVPMIMNSLRKSILLKSKKDHLDSFDVQDTFDLTKISGINRIDRRKMFAWVIDYLGGKLKTIICGGAALSDDLFAFFETLGICVVRGYGITECSPLVSSTSDRNSLSVGEISPFSHVKIEDKEICVRGHNVMLGYYKMPEQTSLALKGGWFHTGDIGIMENGNHLRIIGRKDHLIVNSNGENINPELIEEKLNLYDQISGSVVYSENDLLTAKIWPSDKLRKNTIEYINQQMMVIVDKINRDLPVKMRIERIKVQEGSFDRTSSMKVKRITYKETEYEQ